MEWVVKEKNYTKAQFDSEVMISNTVAGGKKIICFRFRKNSFYKIIKNSDFVMVGREGNKIYFKETTGDQGFKMREIAENQRYLRIPSSKKFFITDDEIGEYNLKFDAELKLCYINLDAKLTRDVSWLRKD